MDAPLLAVACGTGLLRLGEIGIAHECAVSVPDHALVLVARLVERHEGRGIRDRARSCLDCRL